MEQFLNQYATLIVLYLAFQVGLFTFVRMFKQGNRHELGFTREKYLISLIPVIGILYVVILIFKYALEKD